MRTHRFRPLLRFTPLAAALASLAPQAYAGCTAVPPPSPTPVFCVVNANPSGPGSLEQAFLDASNFSNCANTSPTIGFNITGTGPFIIAPSSTLSFGCNVGPMNGVLDGSTQAGYQANGSATGWDGTNPIVISGTSMVSSPGLDVPNYGYGGSLTVKGIDFQNFTYGGATAISGQVHLFGNRVLSSTHGANVRGIFDGAGPVQARIGGGFNYERNVFADNANASIIVSGETSNVRIENNLIGTRDGTSPGSGGKGIHVSSSNNIEIVNNVISGNNGPGVILQFSYNITLTDNDIGTRKGAGAALGNTGHGILSDSTVDVLASNNTIANNGGDGFQVFSGFRNEITGNRIFLNGVKPINLGGVVPPVDNDAGDGDGGPNDQQNYPLVSSVVKNAAANTTTINWTLDSVSNTDYTVEFFSNPGISGPQATNFLNPLLVSGSTGGNTGAGNFIFGTATVSGLHDYITATAIGVASLPAVRTKSAKVSFARQTSEVSPMVLARGFDLTPATLAFGNVVVSTSSGSLTSTMTSLGADPATISYIGDSTACYGGSPPCSTGSFSCSTTCTTTSYAASASCTFTAQFNPLTTGPQTTTVQICDNGGGPRTLTLTGNGVPPPPPTLTPSFHNFGTVSVGGLSAPTTFTLTNPAPAAVSVSPFTASAPFQLQGSTCTSSLAGGASCTADVKFAPTAPGPAAGVLQVSSAGGTLTATLNGNGTVVPTLAISPSSFDFGSVLVGATSALRAFDIQNSGATTTALSGVGTSAGFEIASTNCGASLAPAASCTANVRFAPSISGPVAGTLSATGAGGTTSVSLAGTGERRPVVEMPTDAIDFGALTLDGDPVVRVITLRNTGNNVLGINSIGVALPFVVQHNCPVSLGEGSSCEIRVGFDPEELGDFSGLLSISTNAPGATSIQIRVTGKVQPRPEPLIRVSPASIGFGARLAGSPAPTQTVTIRNEGGAIANLNVVLNMPHFSLVNSSCGTTLAPQASCAIELGFAPQGFGPRRASLVVTSNSPDSPASVSLSGVGCRPDLGAQNRGGGAINCSP